MLAPSVKITFHVLTSETFTQSPIFWLCKISSHIGYIKEGCCSMEERLL